MYATGALANLRAYDPNPVVDPLLEEKIRERRVRDAVEAFMASRQMNTSAKYARRWMRRWRAAKVMQAKVRGFTARKAMRIEVAERANAATQLQKSYRDKLKRDAAKLEQQQQDRAAALLQARSRGRTARQANEAGATEQEASAEAVAEGVDGSGGQAVDLVPEEPAPAPAASECVVVFGGDDASRAQLSKTLAARCGGTHMTKMALLNQRQGKENDDGRLLNTREQFNLLLPLIASQPPPYVLDSIFKIPAHLAALEEVVGAVRLGVQAPGQATSQAAVGMAKKLEGRLYVAPSLEESAVAAVPSAVQKAGIRMSAVGATAVGSAAPPAPTPAPTPPAPPAPAMGGESAASTGKALTDEEAAATKLQAIKRGNDERANLAADAVNVKLKAAMSTDEGYAELKALFESLDKDGDGKVTGKEWGSAVHKNKDVLAKFFGGATMKEIGQAFRRLDTDGSGDLTWDEFEAGADAIGAPPPSSSGSAAATVATATVAAATATPPAEGRTGSKAVIVFGESADALSRAVAAECGGTVVDLGTLSKMAEEDPSEEGEKLLAVISSGGMVSMPVCLPLLTRVASRREAPFVMNAWPRMMSQLQKVEGAMGAIAIGVQAGGGDVSDSRLCEALTRRGTAVHSASGSGESEVAAVVEAMRCAGVSVAGGQRGSAVAAAPAATEEEVAAATKLQAIKRGNDERANLAADAFKPPLLLAAAIRAKACVPVAAVWLSFGGKRLADGWPLSSSLRVRGGGAGASAMTGLGNEPLQEKTADEWFKLLDANKDATLTVKEVRSFLTAATDSATILKGMGVANVDEAIATVFKYNPDADQEMSREEFCRSFPSLKMRGRLCLAPERGLIPHDFFSLWHEKVNTHLAGTREWAFAEICVWLDGPLDGPQLFWLMGGGGTGKSVLTAALHQRIFERVVAWHYCRHDNPQASAPNSLLRSLAAMLCHRLPGYADALGDVPAETVTDPKELFAAFFEAPLKAVQAPAQPQLLIIDALDELPRESQEPLLSVIAGQLSQLPVWLRLFVTSREELQIKTALSKFTPKELRADQANNRTDVEVYLRTIARKYVKGEVNMADIEAAVKRTFGIDMQGKLVSLQAPVDMSRAVYSKVHEKLSGQDGYKALIDVPEQLNRDLVQSSDDFDTVYHKQASAAQAKLMSLVADEWVIHPNKETLQHPAEGKARRWVEFADSPGIKGEPRSREKMANDYGGHANKLKDLARLTLRFSECRRMVDALVKELGAADIQVLTLKNKYASPTPMGYSDFNLCVGVVLDDGTQYVCEMQLNLVEMLEAKHEAHVYYETVRTTLPPLCAGTAVDAGELEGFIVGQLSTSALDAAVEALSQKAEGLFLYAHLLEKHLEEMAGRTINFVDLGALPTGLREVYAVNFKRAFPNGKDDPAWKEAKPLIELIVAASLPVTVEVAEVLLDWKNEPHKARVLASTALLFPVREGTFHVFHKSVIDWLMCEPSTDGSGTVPADAADFAVERMELRACFAAQLDKVAQEGAEAERVWRRRVVEVLVNMRLPASWLPTVAVAARGIEADVAQLVGPLASSDLLEVGTRVLAMDKYGLWKPAVVSHIGDTIDVKIQGWEEQGGLPRTQALVVASDGAGALLRVAAGVANTLFVEELLNAGVSVLVADAHANTPLHVAAAAGHVAICRALMAKGADKDVKNQQNQAAVLLAQAKRQHAVTRLFNPTLSDREFTITACEATPRLKAACNGDVATLGKTQDDGAITALMVACRQQRLEVVEVLDDTDLDAQSASGCTALYLAAEEGDEHIVRLLISRGAKIEIASSDGGTPLQRACVFGHEQCARALLEAGADVEKPNNNGWTPLMKACSNGHEQVARALLEARADKTATTDAGFTALALARRNGHSALCTLLQ